MSERSGAMGPTRFDVAVCAIGRRGMLRGMLAFGGARLFQPSQEVRAAGEPCAEHGSGERCRNNGQCCSNRCHRTRGKRKGKCRCSGLRAPCATDGDCCGNDPLESGHPVCDIPALGLGERGCCMLNQAPCQTSADCCRPLACDGLGFCRPE